MKKISTIWLIAFSIYCAGLVVNPANSMARPPVVIDGTCDLNTVPVSPEIKALIRKWLTKDGRLRASAPKGVRRFLRVLKTNNDIIRDRCSERVAQ